MGWPLGHTSLEPLPKEEFDAWLEGFTRQDLRDVRQAVQPASHGQRSSSGCEAVPCAEALQQDMRQQQKRTEAAELSMACEEASEGCMRGMRLLKETDGAPLRPRPDEQRSVESSDAMQSLPRLLARYGKEGWTSGRWEDAVARTVHGMPHRAYRIKAIGNGQVPKAAATAWRILTEGGPTP